MRRLRFLLSSVTLALALLPAGALVASADEDPPARPDVGDPRVRPPLSELKAANAITSPAAPRPVEVAPAPPLITPSRQSEPPELVVVVGGYGSEFMKPDTLPDFINGLQSSLGPRYHVIRFGDDPRFRYDTYGPLDDNARSLAAQIHSLGPSYGATHIVTHSMGGNVANNAFANGLLSSRDVTTYTALSAPHDGSRAAAIAERTLGFAGVGRAEADEIARSLPVIGNKIDTPATRDLATVRRPDAPAGVVRLDLRLATDPLVSAVDSSDGSVASRTLLPHCLEVDCFEGHGGTLKDPMARDLVRDVIRARAVPPDGRSWFERRAAGRVAAVVDGVAGEGLEKIAWGVLGLAFVLLQFRPLRQRVRVLRERAKTRLPFPAS